MKKILHFLMLSCTKATELIEKKTLFNLSALENFQLKLHTSICDACTNYENQSKIIDDVFRDRIQSTKSEQIDIIKNDPLKEKILKKISKSQFP